MQGGPTGEGAAIEELEVAAYRVPTDGHESDGTLEWDATTLVVVHARAGGERGIGYTYADRATGEVIRDTLGGAVAGTSALDVPAAYAAMRAAVRNLSRRGIASMALSAVDAALWDLKARLLGVPLSTLLGTVRPSVAAYGSGGFTSYPVERLRAQLAGWVDQGFRSVKMKVGRDPRADRARVAAARDAIGGDAELFVDANGAYGVKQALGLAGAFAAAGVTWLEEPVPMDDVEGLCAVRDRAPPPLRVAAGEYGYELDDFRELLARGAVDVLQADATRCGGPTGFLRAAALAEAWHRPLSSHCAPSLHVALMCAAPTGIQLEWFHDHVRIEQALFDGAPSPAAGSLAPDPGRPGLGIELKERDAARFEL